MTARGPVANRQITRRIVTVVVGAAVVLLLMLPAAAMAQSYPPTSPPSPSPSPTASEPAGDAGPVESLPQTGGPFAPGLAVGLLAAGGIGAAYLRRRR